MQKTWNLVSCKISVHVLIFNCERLKLSRNFARKIVHENFVRKSCTTTLISNLCKVGLCQHQLATVTARIDQETKTRNRADILDGVTVSEPLSDTVLRMSREQLAAALLEIASPQKSPWLVSEVHDVVSF